MDQIIGYKLIKISDGVMIDSWTSLAGQLSSPPSVIYLPDNIQVHAPELDIEYFGHKLVYMHKNNDEVTQIVEEITKEI
jgi:hypothetical protein